MKLLYSLKKLILLLMFTSLLVACSSEKQESSTPKAESATLQNDSTDTAKKSTAEAQAVEQATFTDLEGNAVDIAEFEGKVVLIDFWETWCKPCLASFPTMQQLMDDYPEQFVVLAVTPGFLNTKEDASEFSGENDYDFVYLFDENKLHQKLNVQGIPFKVFVDAEGNFIEMSMGSRGPEGDYKHAKEIIEKHS